MKRKTRPWVRWFISLTLITAIFYFAFQIYAYVSSTFSYMSRKNSQETEIKQLEKEDNELKEEKAKLENPDYILKYARGKYLLSGEGETIIKLPSKEQ